MHRQAVQLIDKEVSPAVELPDRKVRAQVVQDTLLLLAEVPELLLRNGLLRADLRGQRRDSDVRTDAHNDGRQAEQPVPAPYNIYAMCT